MRQSFLYDMSFVRQLTIVDVTAFKPPFALSGNDRSKCANRRLNV